MKKLLLVMLVLGGLVATESSAMAQRWRGGRGYYYGGYHGRYYYR